MKFRTATTAGLLMVGFGSASLAIPPCVERPTPPPCCADGRCMPNPMTFGWYETRWRRWPLENVQEPPKGPAGELQLKNEIPRFESPPAEEEDRKAPPPTVSHDESGAARIAPGGAQTPGGQSGAEGRGAPPTTPIRENEPPTAPRRTLPPYDPQNPGATPGMRPLNNTGPTGELDPPPSLPFGPQLTREPAPVREANRGPALQPPRPVRPANAAATSDDPPPALPGTFATLSN